MFLYNQHRTRKPSGCKAYPQTLGKTSSDFIGMKLTYSTNASDYTGLYDKGTVIKAKCNDGYVLKTNQDQYHRHQDRVRPLRKKCRRNGSWVGRGDDMKCELITCPSLQETGYLTEDVVVLAGSCSGGVGGNVESTTGRIPVKTKCRFSCIDKIRYKMIGSKIARCTKNSEWKLKGGRPKCTMRHKYKKKEKKEKKKRKKKKMRPKVKGNEHSHKDGHKTVNEISYPVTKRYEEVGFTP